jgi:phage tail tube protein FII
MYFNKRHNRVGSLFQGTYKASKIESDSYWMHISRYIHLNPVDLGDYKNYPYSSYKIFMGETYAEWVHPEKVLNSFNNSKEYEKFVKSYLEQRKDLKEISRLLANSKELEE